MVVNLECKHAMERVMTPYGVSWRCSKCHGSMINLALFKRNINEKYTKDLWALAMKGSTSEIKCPQCNLEMKEVTKYNGDSYVKTNICKKCHIIWFTQGNLEKASEVFPVQQKKDDHLPEEKRKMLAIEQVKKESVKYSLECQDDFDPRALVAVFGCVFEVEDENENTSQEKRPYVTWSIIAFTSIISLFVLYSGRAEEIFVQFGYRPSEGLRYGGITMITSFFLYENISHLISNMYFLWVFGDNVENRLDWLLYLVLLFSAVIFGNLMLSFFASDMYVACIGSSGGISGVLIFYCLAFPKKPLLIKIGRSNHYFTSSTFGALWLVIQIFGTFDQNAGEKIVLYSAQIGGAIIGICMWAFLRNDKEHKYIRNI
jgi:membrane associated rhomboid family serine protease/Zn-finger nucleic acid-binding protein